MNIFIAVLVAALSLDKPRLEQVNLRTLQRGSTLSATMNSKCVPPCDVYEVQYNYKGSFVADAGGVLPMSLTVTWPCDPQGTPVGDPNTGSKCRESLGQAAVSGVPRSYTAAYRVHNANGWSPLQLLTSVVQGPEFTPPPSTPTAVIPTPIPCVNVPWGRTGPYGDCYNCAGSIVSGTAVSMTFGTPCVASSSITPVPIVTNIIPTPPVVPTFTPGTCVDVPWGMVGPYGRCYNCAGSIVPGLVLSNILGVPCAAPSGTTPVPTLTAVPTPPVLTNQILTVPIAASIHGAMSSFFHSDLWIMNRSFSSTNVVTATYRCFGGVNCGTPVQITLTPRQVKYFPDVIGKTFKTPESGGAIEFTWSGLAGDVDVITRVYTPSSPPTYGFGVEGLPSSAALSRAIFIGVAGNSQATTGFRSNAGAYNPNSFPVTITFTLMDGTTGALLGMPFTRIWAPFEAAQISNVFAMVGAGSVTSVNGILLASVSGGSAFLYTVVIDNLSGDAYQIAAAPDTLLPSRIFDVSVGLAARARRSNEPVPTGRAGLSAPMSGERAITKRLGLTLSATIILVLLVCALLIYVIRLRRK